ncbi:ParA family protein [Niallia alba]|uniref:ParA family protein n=1 Tax=Niallia alba TaxID=2729105 RepID=UPI002E210312|nr:ParA family protein [Niallia alba]
MEILIFSQNSIYKELIDKMDNLHAHMGNIDYSNKEKIDAVLLDGDSFDINNIGVVREKYPSIPMYFKPTQIKSEQFTKTITRLCAAYKVTLIHEYSTELQVVEYCINNLTNKDDYLSKRIIGIFGTHNGAGVSSTTLNLGRALSLKVKEKVLVLSLNSWDPADYFYLYQGQYLNDLKVDLNVKNLTINRLSEAIYYHDSFYHLAGNRDIKMQRFYKSYEIEHLIQTAQQLFDVILIDAGTHFDSALAAQAYLSSNMKFLVTNQEEKGYKGYYPYLYQQIIEPSGGKNDDFMLVINKFQPANALISEKKLEEELNMNRVVTIPDMKELGSIATFEKKLLYDFSDSSYNKPIDVLANVIIAEAKLTEKEDMKTHKDKKGFLSIFNR